VCKWEEALSASPAVNRSMIKVGRLSKALTVHPQGSIGMDDKRD
jgi:hypothetical protein